MQKEKVDLKEILEEVKADFDLIFKQKKQTVFSTIDRSLEIYGDTDRLTLLFKSLISNASKFSNQETQISISAIEKENAVVIAIKNEGNGLSDADMECLFVKFASLTTKATANENSNGLGLSLAKLCADMHNGKIWAETDSNEVTFYTELPIE